MLGFFPAFEKVESTVSRLPSQQSTNSRLYTTATTTKGRGLTPPALAASPRIDDDAR
ncbi:hypothetical protein SMG44B_30219 [Stenotrophomonas maltophilia]